MSCLLFEVERARGNVGAGRKPIDMNHCSLAVARACARWRWGVPEGAARNPRLAMAYNAIIKREMTELRLRLDFELFASPESRERVQQQLCKLAALLWRFPDDQTNVHLVAMNMCPMDHRENMVRNLHAATVIVRALRRNALRRVMVAVSQLRASPDSKAIWVSDPLRGLEYYFALVQRMPFPDRHRHWLMRELRGLGMQDVFVELRRRFRAGGMIQRAARARVTRVRGGRFFAHPLPPVA